MLFRKSSWKVRKSPVFPQIILLFLQYYDARRVAKDNLLENHRYQTDICSTDYFTDRAL